MPNTGYFRASSVNVTGGENITGEDNLHSEGTGQFNADVNRPSELKVKLFFTDFFIPEGNRITGIEYIIGGTAETQNIANVESPLLQAGNGGTLGTLTQPAPTEMGTSGLITSATNTQYLPSNHTHTLDAEYAALAIGNVPGITQNVNAINTIVGNTPDRKVILEITLQAFVSLSTLTLDGTNPGGGFIPLPSIKIFYES